jgi:hypothetical protein
MFNPALPEAPLSRDRDGAVRSLSQHPANTTVLQTKSATKRAARKLPKKVAGDRDT